MVCWKQIKPGAISTHENHKYGVHNWCLMSLNLWIIEFLFLSACLLITKESVSNPLLVVLLCWTCPTWLPYRRKFPPFITEIKVQGVPNSYSALERGISGQKTQWRCSGKQLELCGIWRGQDLWPLPSPRHGSLLRHALLYEKATLWESPWLLSAWAYSLWGWRIA